MPDFSLQTKLNENNIQAPFQYKPSENGFILNNINDEIALNNNSVQVKVIDEEKLFCVDLGYSVDGEVYEMNFYVDKIKIFPVQLNKIEELRAQEIEDNKVYFVKDTNFKSIAFFSIANLNKTFSFEITSYASVFSSWMFDEIAKKINGLDTNYPVKNFYPQTKYEAGDIIKKDGYLYQVIKDFTSNDKLSNSIIITPFVSKENSSLNMYDLLQDSNKFFIVNSKDGDIKPLTSVITWSDNITEIYKDTIIIKKDTDGNVEKKYLVLNNVLNPKFDKLIEAKNIIELYTAKDILYNNEEVNNLQDGLDLAFTKIKTETEERNEKDAELQIKINTKQNNLNAGDNIEIVNDTSEADIKVVINNKYDLNYKKSVFPKIAYEIPDEIIFSLYLVDSVNKINATIKKINGAYTFKTTITITETKENITLNITNINAVDLSQFFTPNTTYELENCNLIFSLNDMTLTLTPKAKENSENGTFEAGNLTLEYIFITIYNKNIFFITQNNGYIELKQDETAGEPKGSIIKFEKTFETITEEAGVDFVELDILNNIIAQYFNTIENFNINNFIETDGIYFVRTTQEGDAEPVITTEKANFGMILDTQNNYYRFGICRRDKGKIKNNDTVVISIYPDLNKQLDTVEMKANNLNETLQSLTENIKETQNDLNTEKTTRENKDNELETKITEITNNLNTEITNREEADTELQNKINAESQKIGNLTALKTNNKDDIVVAINETYDKAGTGGGSVDIHILEGQPYDTGETLDGKKIKKIMWRDIKNNAIDIKQTLEQLEMSGAIILDTKVFGNATYQVIDIMTEYLDFPCPYLVNWNGEWNIGIIHHTIQGSKNNEVISFDSVDKTYIKAIEITYLE